MRFRFFPLVALIWLSPLLRAQREASAPARFQLYGGYTYLSNSLNGMPGSRQPLNGWDAAVAFPAWHNLRVKFDVYKYNGSNLGAPQHPLYFMAGGQYSWRFRRETIFGEALVGDLGINRNWGPNGIPGGTAAFTTLAGGGLDTPITRHFGYRASGGFQYSYTSLLGSAPLFIPYRIAGLPNYFGRISTGLVVQF